MKWKEWLLLPKLTQNIILNFKLWAESKNSDAALTILNGNQQKLTNLLQFNQDKYLPIIAYFYNQNIPLDQLKDVFKDVQELDNKKQIQTYYTKQGIMLNKEIYTNWLKFSEKIHGIKSTLQFKNTKQIKTDDENHQQYKIFSNDKFDIYLTHSPQACISLGKGQSFCISQPGNTMWKSYRDTQVSTFYFVKDKTKQPSDPLSLVVVDINQNGISLTDKKNTTGTISEYGTDSAKYMEYLYVNGVPKTLFKNMPKTQEENEENKLLGTKNEDLDWFKSLNVQQQSAYIGRGYQLTNEQFDYLISKNNIKLLNQYTNIGHTIPKYQFDKLNPSLLKSYLRQRLMAAPHNKLKDYEYSALDDNNKQYVLKNDLIEDYVKIKIAQETGNQQLIKGMNLDNALNKAASRNDLEIVKYLISLGANDLDLALTYAAANGHLNMMKYLIDAGATYLNSSLASAAENGNLDAVKYLVNAGADNLNYALGAAAGSDDVEVVKYLVNAGADNLNDALTSAAGLGRLDAVKYLVDAGANNLDFAAEAAFDSDYEDVLQYLINKGATFQPPD